MPFLDVAFSPGGFSSCWFLSGSENPGGFFFQGAFIGWLKSVTHKKATHRHFIELSSQFIYKTNVTHNVGEFFSTPAHDDSMLEKRETKHCAKST